MNVMRKSFSLDVISFLLSFVRKGWNVVYYF